jgi:PBSX family phage terminase large subunit
MPNFVPFSPKQRKIFSWWHPESPVKDADGIIADGSIRAGKTFPMAMSFIEWAFASFDNQAFAFCGKTVGALRRNILFWLLPLLRLRGYHVHERRTENLIILTNRHGKRHHFYYFGGKDESSQDLIQGVTLAGVLFDEVALMPESFVNQATGRCSVEGAKFWFNCNPGSPSHWFKLKWLNKHRKKKLLHLHFTMDDNPSMSEKTKERYKSLYVGVFFKRMILGLWVAAHGAIYDMFDDVANMYDDKDLKRGVRENATEYIAIDVGTQNATVFLYILDDGWNIWVEDEYYHSGRDSESGQKTNSQYVNDLDKFCEGRNIHQVIIDPSAASFKAELKLRGYRIKDADNDVLEGIKLTASVMGSRILRIHRRCKNLVREIQGYVWDPKPTEKGNEKPLKKDDHGCDALRYFIKTIFKPRRFNQERQAA